MESWKWWSNGSHRWGGTFYKWVSGSIRFYEGLISIFRGFLQVLNLKHYSEFSELVLQLCHEHGWYLKSCSSLVIWQFLSWKLANLTAIPHNHPEHPCIEVWRVLQRQAPLEFSSILKAHWWISFSFLFLKNRGWSLTELVHQKCWKNSSDHIKTHFVDL